MRFQFLGEISIEGGGTQVTAHGDQPALTLARLVLERPSPLSREELADLLWPGPRPSRWEGPARQVVSRARALLVSAGAPPSCVTSRGGQVELDLGGETELWVDVETALRAAATAERRLGAQDWEGAAELSELACDHLRLPFFAASDATWTGRWQDRMRAQLLRSLLIGAEAAMGAGAPALAVALAGEALAADPFDEVATRALMSAYDALGSRGQALTAYEEYRSRLDHELGVRPSEDTEAAYLALVGSAPRIAIRAVTPARQATRTDTLPFVGRRDERARVDGEWHAVRDGAMRGVVIAGESGIGKTRFAEEIARDARRDGALVLWGTCVADVGLPYQPFGELLTQLVAARPAALDHLGPLAPDLATLVPSLAPAQAAAPALDEQARVRLFRAVQSALDVIASEPVMIVLDDLQFADEDALALLRHLTPVLAERPCMLAVTARVTDGPLAVALADLQRRIHTVTVGLGGLTVDDLVEVLQFSGVELAGEVRDVARELEEHTTGNPFYVTQLVFDAHATHRAFDAGALPHAVAQLVARRIEALDRDAASTLAIAAVAGAEFDLATIERCSALVPEQLLDIVESLCRQRFLVERDAERFAFAHAIVRDAVLATIGATRRQRLHRRLADALAAVRAEPTLLAHHYLAAGATSARDATRSLLAAGHAALAQSAWAAARDHFTVAADLAAEVDDQCQALIGLGRAQRALGHAAEGRSAVWIALGIARAHHRGRAAAAATLALVGGGGRGVAVDLEDAARADLLREALAGLEDDDIDLLVGVLGELALALVLTDAKEERDALAQRCVREARRGSDADSLAVALQARRIALMGPGGTPARVADGREALALPRAAVAPERVLAAQLGLVEDLIELGDRAGVDAAIEAARAGADRLAHPYWSWATTSWRALVAVIDGRLDDAEALAFEAFACQAPADHPEAVAALGVTLVDVRLFQDRAGEMLDLLRDAADQNPQIPAYRAVLALCCTSAGDLSRAQAAYGRLAARDFVLPPDSNWLLAIAVLADAAATLRDPAGALVLKGLLEPFADRHVVLNCFGGGGAYWGPVEHHLGRLEAVLGNVATARTRLEAAVDSCVKMRATGFEARSRAALAAVAAG